MYKHVIHISIVISFFLPIISYGQTNVSETVGNLIGDTVNEQFEKETGLDQIPSFDDLSAQSAADSVVAGIVGNIPSPTMGQLADETLKLFKVYTTSKKYSVCERAANSRAWDALGQVTQKAHFGPWIDIAWTAVKSIADGGKTVSELVAENTKAELQKLIADALNNDPPKPEIKKLEFGGKCNTNSVTKWDAKTKKIVVTVTGDCGCTRQKVGLSKPMLAKFEVRIEGLVKSAVRLKQSPLWWRDPQPQIQYKVYKIRVFTKADCTNSCPLKDGMEDISEEKSLFGRFIAWVSGLFDTSDDVQDTTEQPVDMGESAINEHVAEEDTGDVSGTPDNPEREDIQARNENEDSIEDIVVSEDDLPREPEEATLQCGDTVSVDGRSNVSTYPYRPDEGIDVNFSCSNSCDADEICKVLPESVRASGKTCVYCARIAAETDEEQEDEPAENTVLVTCTLPSKQSWNNALMSGFTYTVLGQKRVRVENSGSYCGIDSLEEFKKTADATMRFFSCPSIKTSDFVYTDIRGSCSFIAQFGG